MICLKQTLKTHEPPGLGTPTSLDVVVQSSDVAGLANRHVYQKNMALQPMAKGFIPYKNKQDTERIWSIY